MAVQTPTNPDAPGKNEDQVADAAQMPKRDHSVDLFLHAGQLSCFVTPPRGAKETPVEFQLFVAALNGEEAISHHFSFDVDIHQQVWNMTFGLQELLGQPAWVGWQPSPGSEYQLWRRGIVNRVTVLREEGQHIQFRLRIVPRAWRLTQNRTCRIFQDQSIKQIVLGLLDASSIPCAGFEAANEPLPRPYCVQYQESDWTFISRLLEEEGYSYFFAHTDEKGEVLHITNRPAQAPRAKTLDGKRQELSLPYRPATLAPVKPDEDFIPFLGRYRAVCPSSVTHREQIFDKPWLLETRTKEEGDEAIEVYEYLGAPKTAPVQAAQPVAPSPAMPMAAAAAGAAAGAASAGADEDPAVRLDELRVRHLLFEGKSTSLDLISGHHFELKNGHVQGDRELALHIRHQAEQHHREPPIFRYGNRFTCQPAQDTGEVSSDSAVDQLPFRPARWTPRPTIPGPQSAVVVGPPNEEIYTDKLGRVKVQFPWDREGKFDDHSSCWVPVALPWAGQVFGVQFIPRVGHQVIVQFIDGDPDQPIVTAEVHHQRNLPPYELPARKTVSTIKTESSPRDPKRPGYNELRFEDRQRKEEVYFRAQRNRNDLIRVNYSTVVGHNEKLKVKNDYYEEIGHNHGQWVQGDKTIQVDGKHTERIVGPVDYYVRTKSIETIKEDRIATVGGILHEKVGKSRRTQVVLNDKHLVGGRLDVEVHDDLKLLSSDGDINIISEQDKITVEAPKEVIIKCGRSTVQLTPHFMSLRFGNSTIAVKADSITIKSDDVVVQSLKAKVN